LTEERDDLDTLKKEFEVAKELNLPVTYSDTAEVPFKVYGAIEYHHQARFHPGKYIAALAKILDGKGSYVFEQSRVLDVEESEPCVIKTELGEIKADDVVIATHFPILDRGGYFARMKSARSYVLGAYIKEELPIMYDDTVDPFHYVRNQETEKGMLVIIGGEDHETGSMSDTEECFLKLEAYARSHFTVTSIDYFWSTQDNYPYDRVPFIGKYTPLSEHLYVTTGFYGEGMTQSTIGGLLLTDLILGNKNDWTELYSPQRLKIQVEGPQLVNVGIETVKEEVGSMLEKIVPSDDSEKIAELVDNESKVIKVNNKKVAVYKDEEKRLHSVSADCGHQGCEVVFNKAEKSWDCPCHGSRFSIDGKILHGPTVKALPAVNIKP
jgi:nitrite reductase/ring-hydroxylating ferredoxin subunit